MNQTFMESPLQLLDQIAEARIREANERGELDDLPGAGMPLRLDDDRMVPEHLRAAYRLLKNAGYLPPEVQLLREIRDIEALLKRIDGDAQRGLAARRLDLLRARLATQRGETSPALLDDADAERLRQRLALEPVA
jgi:hypothetical protein